MNFEFFLLLLYSLLTFYYVWRLISMAIFLPKISPANTGKKYTKSKISVIIPCWNERDNIRRCAQSFLRQKDVELEIIMVDNDSSDETWEVMRELKAENPHQIKCLQSGKTPPTWQGKNFACHLAQKKADGDFLLFVDADTYWQKHTLQSILEICKANDVDLYSQLPRIVSQNPSIKLFITYVFVAFMKNLNFTKLNKENSQVNFASGHCLFFKKSSYQKIGGHEAVKERINEDLALCELVKKTQLKVWLANACAVCECEMYKNMRDTWHGMARILNHHRGNPIVIPFMLVQEALTFASFLLAFINPAFIIFPSCFVILLGLALASQKLNPLYAIGMPILSLSSLAFFLHAFYLKLRKKTLPWRKSSLPQSVNDTAHGALAFGPKNTRSSRQNIGTRRDG